jgi:hypothetical protein
MNTYSCPNCGSENTAAFPMAHAQKLNPLPPPPRPAMRPFVIFSIILIGLVAGYIFGGLITFFVWETLGFYFPGWGVILLLVAVSFLIYKFMLNRHLPEYLQALDKWSITCCVLGAVHIGRARHKYFI